MLRSFRYLHVLAIAPALIVLVLPGCDSRRLGDPESQVLGQWNIDVIRASDTATGYLIDGSVALEGDDHAFGASASDFPEIAELGVCTDDSTSELLNILLDPTVYEWESAKGCIPTPGVKLSFRSPEHVVDILFCFECDILSVYRDNERMSGGNFDHGRRRFVQWLQRQFPDHPDIQKLDP